MADRPIIFSAPMVRALLDGRKTQTRRILKPQPSEPVRVLHTWYDRVNGGIGKPITKFFPGDRLWVRENWRKPSIYFDVKPAALPEYVQIWHEADGRAPGWTADSIIPSIHMPRWASRLTLIVTGVKVERLQDISNEDAIAEGIVEDDGDTPGIWYCPGGWTYGVKRLGATPAEAFRYLWEAINGADSWDASPWVVAVSFTVHRCNINERQS